MTIESILRDIFDESLVKASADNLDKGALWRTFVIEIPDANNFRYGFIYTDTGIRDFDPDERDDPVTIKMRMEYSTFSAILKKQIKITDAIYYGYVTCIGENALLHTNILLSVFSNMIGK